MGFLSRNKTRLKNMKVAKSAGFLFLILGLFYILLNGNLALAKDFNFGAAGDRIFLNGNVGAGTTNPLNPLHVNGGSTATPGTIGSYAFRADSFTIGSDSSYVYLQSWSSKPLQINNQGNNTLINPVSGYVGIGTTNPGVKLDVRAGSGSARLRATDTDYNKGTEIGADGTGGYVETLNAGSNLRFYSGAASLAVTILDGGNVGIGTAGPGARLSVYNSTNQPNGAGKPGSVLQLGQFLNAGTGEGPAIDFNLRWSGGYEDTNLSTGWIGARIAGIYDSSAGNGGALVFLTNGGTGASGGANSPQVTEKMRIRPDGNVGVGTSFPADKLSIGNGGSAAPAGSSNTGHNYTSTYLSNDDYALVNYGLMKTALIGGSNALWSGTKNGAIYNGDAGAGTVGIGAVSSAGTKLFIDSDQGTTNNAALKIIYSGATTVLGEVAALAHRNSQWDGLYVNGTGSSLTNAVFVEGNKPVIFNAGNFGIGTTNPETSLHISSASPTLLIRPTNPANDAVLDLNWAGNNSDLRLRYNPNSAMSYIETTYTPVAGQVFGDIAFRTDAAGTPKTLLYLANYIGNVGIGTTNPQYAKLQVDGSNGPLIVGNITSGYGGIGLSLAGVSKFVIGYAGNASNYGSQTSAGDTAFNTYGANMHFNTGTGNSPTLLFLGANSGNVGIGTTNPQYKLQVTGDVSLTAGNRFSVKYTTDESYLGSFGYNYLHLGENGNNWIIAGNSAVGGNLKFVVNNTNDYRNYGDVPNGITAMTLANTGSVGIGTMAPLDKLSIGNSGAAPAGSSATGHNFTSTYLSTDNYALTNYGVVKSLVAGSSASQGIKLLSSGAGMIVNGNTITRSVAGGWDGQAYSQDGFVGGAYTSVVVNNLGYSYMIGLNTDPTTDASYCSIDYAWYITASTNGYIYESCGNPASGITLANGDVLAIVYDGTNVKYLQNGVVRRTVAANITGPLYFDSSLTSGDPANPIVSNIQLGPVGNSVWATNGANINNANTGNVGIGITNPSSPLTVYGSKQAGSVNISAQSATNATSNYAGLMAISSTGKALYMTMAENTYGTDAYFAHQGDATIAVTTGGRLHLRAGAVDSGITLDTSGNTIFTSGTRVAFNGSAFTTGSAYGVGNGMAYNNLNSIAVDTLETDSGVGGSGILELVYYGGLGVRVGAGEGNKWIAASQFVDGNNTAYYVDPASTSYLNAANFAGSLTFTQSAGARNVGIIGTYDPTRVAAIWSMGAAYQIGADGTGGNLYGLSYSYEPNYGGSGNNPGSIGGLGHQMQWRAAGVTQTAIGSGIYTVGSVTATSFIYSSDRNLKQNIATISNPLDKILQLRGVTFNWKKDNKPSMGLIAQEVEQVFPELVTGQEGSKAVQYGNLVAPLIEAVKAQQKEIEELKANQKDYDLLQARIKALEIKSRKK